MKLTIIRLFAFSPQDKIDLAKIWPEYASDTLGLSDNERIYAARFNERLLGAVRLTLNNDQGRLDSLRVREITRRRGVGHYLVTEVLKDNPQIKRWWMPEAGVEDCRVMTAFMLRLGFQQQAGGWQK